MNTNEIAVFGGGCFWCTEAIFQKLRGVEKVVSGYAGGTMLNPSYDEVSSGDTGHAEVIRIEFDSSQISYENLLEVFFATHNPTTPNRQGNDVGPQYRSIVFYTNGDQKKTAEHVVKRLADENVFGAPISTTIEPLETFYSAENYHQNYYEQNKDKPYCELVINPKLQKLREKFHRLLR